MAEPQQATRGYTDLNGVCPESGKPTTFRLSLEFAKQVQRHQPYWKFMALGDLEHVLSNPTSLYKDLQRDGFNDAYCYFGRPKHLKRSPTIETPFPPDQLLAVYVAWDDRGLIILDWEKRDADPSNPAKPLDGEKDFGGAK